MNIYIRREEGTKEKVLLGDLEGIVCLTYGIEER